MAERKPALGTQHRHNIQREEPGAEKRTRSPVEEPNIAVWEVLISRRGQYASLCQGIDEDEPMPPAVQFAFLEDRERMITMIMMLSRVGRSAAARLAPSKTVRLAELGIPLGEKMMVKIIRTRLKAP